MKTIREVDIYFQNDHLDDIIKNPGNYCYEEVIYASLNTIYPKKLLDYLLLNCGIDNKCVEFQNGLISMNCYYSYINSIASSNDDFLKAHVVLYLENNLLYSMFTSEFDLATKIIQADNYDVRYKVFDLMTLTEYKCSEMTIELIKNNIVKFIEEYEDIDKNNKDTIKNMYLKQIEANQEGLESTYVYKME